MENEWNEDHASPQPSGYGMLNEGNTCFVSAALQMLRTVGAVWDAVAEYQVLVCRILKELVRFDSSDWSVRGEISLRPKEDLGKFGDAAEFTHQLIMNMGIEDLFTGVQTIGHLSISATHGWVAEKYPDTTYVRLPITIDTWNEQNLSATICPVGETTYRIDIPVSRLGPELLLFITLQRFGNLNRKIRHRDVTPAEIALGEEIYTRISTLHHGCPSLESCHFWMAENALSRPLSMFITITSFPNGRNAYVDVCVCLSIQENQIRGMGPKSALQQADKTVGEIWKSTAHASDLAAEDDNTMQTRKRRITYDIEVDSAAAPISSSQLPHPLIRSSD